MSHVNLMTDTVIVNLPSDGLRTVLRSILASNPDMTPVFEKHTKTYLQRTPSFNSESNLTECFSKALSLSRAMLGCGMWTQSLALANDVVQRAIQVNDSGPAVHERTLSSLDGDLIQAVTAIEKIQNTRQLLPEEIESIQTLFESMNTYHKEQLPSKSSFPFDRSFRAISSVLGRPITQVDNQQSFSAANVKTIHRNGTKLETFDLRGLKLPRLFTGLWQLSSPSWGVASKSQVLQQFHQYADAGFTAYDMADHYGDAEILFGEFRASHSQPKELFASTKFCVFQPVTVTPVYIHDNVTERCRRLSSDTIELLQFHWQFYDDHQYIKALELLQADNRISALGLCNFDTLRLEEILDAGINVVSNQVQFSLIDSRPTVRMGAVCERHQVKLLTYGTLCGGFIAKKWLGKPEPELFSDGITPSQRKYFDMIRIWGGWTLFQELLQTLQEIAAKHNVSISNVATRWVLDFPYVGAVIVGARMGVSEHVEDNLRTYGRTLDDEDNAAIERVLQRSRRGDIYDTLGDCGGEYRL